MADSKITALPAIASVAGADLLVVVDDVAGTPATTKATVTQVGDQILARTDLAELIRDTIGTALVDGTGIDVVVDDGAETITINSTITGTPGGSDTQVQFNSSGSFAGDSGLTYNSTNKALTVGGATITASAPVLDLTQTWNSGGVTFTGLKLNITNTASSSASLVADLQVGGTSQFKVSRTGAVTVPAGGQNTAGFYTGGGTACGVYAPDNVQLYLVGNSTAIAQVRSDAFGLASSTPLGWGTLGSAPDTFLRRAAAATVQQGNSDAASPVAQKLQVQSVSSGTSNTAGVDWTLQASRPTNTGVAGNIKIDTAFSSPAAAATTVTMTIATPCVVTHAAHGFVTGQPVVFTTTGALPTGITAGTTYYVVTIASSTTTYNLATSVVDALAGTLIATSGTQSGTHTATTTATVQNPALTTITLGPSGLTGSQITPVLDIRQHWNTSGNPSAVSIDVKRATSGATGNILNIKVNGSNRFSVDFNGSMLSGVPISSAGSGGTVPDSAMILRWATQFSAVTSATCGKMYHANTSLASAPTNSFWINLGNGNGSIAFKGDDYGASWIIPATQFNLTSSVVYTTDGADTHAFRRSTNAQVSRFYRTYTDASNYERLALQSGSGYFEIATETAGTGTDNLDLRLTPAGTGNVDFPGGVLLKTRAALTNGAGAAAGTLTNSPVAGDPTKWIPINDNGTTRYIPAW